MLLVLVTETYSFKASFDGSFFICWFVFILFFFTVKIFVTLLRKVLYK